MLAAAIIFISLLFLALIFNYIGFFYISMALLLLINVCLAIFFVFMVLEAYRIIFKGAPPFLPSSFRLIKKILAEINFKDNALVYDLGCGDGRFLRQLVKTNKVRAVGYEYFIFPYLLAQLQNLLSAKKVKFYYRDFFKDNFQEADYIFCYLLPKTLAALETKFQQELKPGALVITNTFAFKNWQPEKVIRLDDGWLKSSLNNNIYLYRK